MKLINKSVKLREDQLTTINTLEINFSEWVRDKIDDELLEIKKIDELLRNNRKEREKLLKIKENVIQGNTDFFKGSSEEIEHLKESKIILQKRPELFGGRINLYTNIFGLKNKPTRKQFLELLESIP